MELDAKRRLTRAPHGYDPRGRAREAQLGGHSIQKVSEAGVAAAGKDVDATKTKAPARAQVCNRDDKRRAHRRALSWGSPSASGRRSQSQERGEQSQ